MVLDRATGADVGEYVYPVDAVPPGGMAQATGVAEILAAGDDAYLTLERTLIPGRGFTGKIYRTTIDGADDVQDVPALTGAERLMRKELVFDFATVAEDSDCIEGITWGPACPTAPVRWSWSPTTTSASPDAPRSICVSVSR